MVAHTFNPGTQGAEAGELEASKVHPGLQDETLSFKTN